MARFILTIVCGLGLLTFAMGLKCYKSTAGSDTRTEISTVAGVTGAPACEMCLKLQVKDAGAQRDCILEIPGIEVGCTEAGDSSVCYCKSELCNGASATGAAFALIAMLVAASIGQMI
ncbi:PREDICTED: uncharacterized protein LOC106812339 isoform X2 [Priapulus caudatus]|uniref:Uncharacterized protein LOC106812339 isoform X1 n=1 Tax=Priapulus caudatus TaxID=37621 RepID=A0ABM1EHK3_PRICU|nr:PREDICTED: uncharacterized protein LOC106812339 isoform X1 [Priapulus caudatus]XP_014671674.1 PREDICTED: uncharacterized protein LOC106812339 isoform X2 [Priapulus caudatus]